MSLTKKHILKAAKQNMVDELDRKLESFNQTWKRLAALQEEAGSQSSAWDRYSSQMDKCVEAIKELKNQRADLLKPKSRKQEIKKSLEWKSDRKDMRAKVKDAERVTISDNDALRRVRAAEISKTKLGFGDWLGEGTLVRHHKHKLPLLVLAVKGGRVEVLDGATSRIYRAKSLRPCDLDD